MKNKKFFLSLVGILGGLLLVQFVIAAPIANITRSLIPETTNTYYVGTTTPSTVSYKGMVVNNINITGLSASNTPLMFYNGSIQSTSTNPFYVSALVATSTTVNSGIGTTTPGSLFSVDGGDIYLASTTMRNLIVASSTASSTFATGGLTVGTNQFVVQQNSGQVGVGTSSPGALLSVSQAANAAGLLIVNSGTNNTFYAEDSANDTTPFVIDASGNVAIGNRNPTDTLHVSGTSRFTSNMAIGTTVTNDTSVRINMSYTGTNNAIVAFNATGVIATSGSNLDNGYGAILQPIYQPLTSSTISGGYSFYLKPYYAGVMSSASTVGMDGLFGVASRLAIYVGNPVGTITDGVAFDIQTVNNENGAGANVIFTRNAGLRIANMGTASGAAGVTITSATGIAINENSGATNNINILIGTLTPPTGNWSIYNVSTMKNYFAGNLGIGTTTPAWGLQIADTRASTTISDTNAGANLKHWTLSSQGGNFYIATSTDLYSTSTTQSALSITNGGDVGISTTTFNGNFGIGPFAKNGSTTIATGKWQIDGYNSAGARQCSYLVGSTFTVTSGACNK